MANLAAFTFAILPLPRANASDGQSDTAHMLLYLTAAWLASSAIVSGRLLPLAAAGLASGVAYWIRPEGLEVFCVALVCLVWSGLRAHWSWRRLGLAGATLAGVTLLVAAPYPILAQKITSKQLPFAKARTAPTFIAQLAEVQPAESEPASAESKPSSDSASAFRARRAGADPGNFVAVGR